MVRKNLLKRSKSILTSFWCEHEKKNLRHEVKVYWQDRTEEYFTCLGCGEKIKNIEMLKNDK
jgi:hypothetical protein